MQNSYLEERKRAGSKIEDSRKQGVQDNCMFGVGCRWVTGATTRLLHEHVCMCLKVQLDMYFEGRLSVSKLLWRSINLLRAGTVTSPSLISMLCDSKTALHIVKFSVSK